MNVLRQIGIRYKFYGHFCLGSQQFQIFDSIGSQFGTKPTDINFKKVGLGVVCWQRVHQIVAIAQSPFFVFAVIVPVIP